MIYEYSCLKCEIHVDRYVHTFDQADDEVCEICGEKLQRLMSGTDNISVWKHTSIPELDKNIHFRSMKHAKEVASAKNLRINQEPLRVFELEYRRKHEERLMRQPVMVDMGRKVR